MRIASLPRVFGTDGPKHASVVSSPHSPLVRYERFWTSAGYSDICVDIQKNGMLTHTAMVTAMNPPIARKRSPPLRSSLSCSFSIPRSTIEWPLSSRK